MGKVVGFSRRALRAAYWRPFTKYLELRYGCSEPPRINNRFEQSHGANDHFSFGYHFVSRVMELVDVRENDVLVDVGCSAGRVLNWWLYRYPANRLVGIELDPELADTTARRLANWRRVNVYAGDAVDLMPPEATIAYLANPFRGDVLERWQKAVAERCPNLHAWLYVRPKYRQHLDPKLWTWTEHPGSETVLACRRK